MRSHPIVMQLQFLPILYAAPDDRILVSDLPENPDPRLCSIDNPPKGYSIDEWGPSIAIASWAKRNGIPYNFTNWEIVRKINSKIFSFEESPKLPGAKCLNTQEEIEDWLKTTRGPKVLKTPFGTAGSGHIKLPQLDSTPRVPNRGPMVGEPWVERVLDFSTQWLDGKLLGTTLFENEASGAYKGTYVGSVESWAFDEHLKVAGPLIEKIGKLGYSGHVGIDAFIYLWEGEKRVHPVVEINARKTMSWVALQTAEKRLYYTRRTTGLLPKKIQNIQFSRNITCT